MVMTVRDAKELDATMVETFCGYIKQEALGG